MEYLVLFSAIVSSLLLWCAVRVFHTIWWKPRSIQKQLKGQGIKGSPYRLLHGDLKDYVKSSQKAWSKPMNLAHNIIPRVNPLAHQMVQTYGKVSFFWFGTTPRLIVFEPELMKEILSNKFGHFQKPPLNPLIDLLTLGLSSLESEKWAKHRRIMTPAFHLEKLQGMTPAFSTSCTELIERLDDLVSSNGSCEVDIWPELQHFSGDVISRTAFGSNFEEGKRIFELQREQSILVIEASQSVYVPGFRFVPTKKNRRRMNLDKEIKAMLRDMILRKERAMSMGESSSDDLLGMLLQSNNANYNKMKIEEVIEECKLFYFAGQETTASWLTWTMVVLAMHPSWQEKARAEILRICGKNTPKFENLNQFKIVTMILYEVIRLYPPVIHQFRYTYKKMKIGDFSLPAGVELMLPTLLIHHNPEFWGDDAEEFKPERFSEGISKAAKEQFAFFPFGWGPRICLGQNFAMIEAKMALVMILQHFSFQISPSYTHAPYTIITLQPQHGAQLIMHRV